MRDSTGVKVSKAIVHLVDTKNNEVTLSDGDMPLAGNKELKDFLCKHIEHSLADSASRSACFMRDGGQQSEVLPHAMGVVEGKGSFVEHTKKMTEHLSSVSGKSTSSGAILFCKYTAENYPKKNFLAILKLDPTIGFQKKERKSKGKTYIRFEKVADLIPSAKERLLKCAFIRYRKVTKGKEFKDFDLMVLDRQQPDEPARYFSGDFLGTQWFKDSSELTETFFFSANEILDDLRDDLGRKKSEIVRKAIDAAINSNEVEIASWADNLNVKKSAKDEIKEKLLNDIPDAKFETDENVAGRLTKRRIFKGAHGFRLSMYSDGYDELVGDRYEEDDCEVLVLKVPDFDEVLR